MAGTYPSFTMDKSASDSSNTVLPATSMQQTSKQAGHTHAHEGALFLKLPQELRDAIYIMYSELGRLDEKGYLVHEEVYKWSFGERHHMGLLGTCHQIREEYLR